MWSSSSFKVGLRARGRDVDGGAGLPDQRHEGTGGRSRLGLSSRFAVNPQSSRSSVDWMLSMSDVCVGVIYEMKRKPQTSKLQISDLEFSHIQSHQARRSVAFTAASTWLRTWQIWQHKLKWLNNKMIAQSPPKTA